MMATKHKFDRRSLWNSFVGSCIVLLTLLLPAGAFQPSPVQAGETDSVGYQGPSFGTAFAPTASEMQSKLWFNDGLWWGSLYNSTDNKYEIYRFDQAKNSWITTGTLIDERQVSRADCLWDGNYLYVASAVRVGSANSDKSIRILRFQYHPDNQRYSLDAGFPVILSAHTTYGVVIDEDSSGTLWATYTTPNDSVTSSVYVFHSDTAGSQWGNPFVLPVTGASDLLVEDISSLVAYNHQIGLMWSNQNRNSIYFTTHQDGDPEAQWQTYAPMQGAMLSDNHIHLKSMQPTSDGRLYAAVKTSLNDPSNANPDDPLLVLLQINPDGTWVQRTFGTVAERHTRPQLLIDQENNMLYLFATSFCCGEANIYYKQLSLNDENAQFPPGVGTPFIKFGAGSNINNVTSTKQAVDSEKDILVLAEDSATSTYVYNRILIDPPPPQPQVSTRLMLPIITVRRSLAP